MTTPHTARLSLVARLASQVVGDPSECVGGDPGGEAQIAADLAPAVHGTRGPARAVDDLVAAHADAVYRYALRLARDAQQAQDLAQETLLRGWQSRHKLREPAAARVWLLRIATNLHRDGLRTARPWAPASTVEAASPRSAPLSTTAPTRSSFTADPMR